MVRKDWLVWALLALPVGPGARVIGDRDQPARIAPGIEMNLKVLDRTSRRAAESATVPWSDLSWKANKGLVNERYLDPEFGAQDGLRAKQAYARRRSVDRILRLPTPERESWIARLSPAEKYDLAVGTVRGGLADNLNGFLAQTLGEQSAFPSWWGLCEGSAPASMYYPEPASPVYVRSAAYDLEIPFYPADVKALATMIWSRFNEKLDLPEAGLQCRRSGEGCDDNNPGSFHASLHHFLDLAPGILVGEVDPSPVVWNFPLVAYSESYFNPQTKTAATALAGAAVSRERWPGDPRASRRAPDTAYVVGVKMRFSYAVNSPDTSPTEPRKRRVSARTVTYELELDRDWNIVGGEWLSGRHPDLLWAVPEGLVPDTVGDSLLPPGEVTADSLREAARAAAARLVPLRYVVESLVHRSARETVRFHGTVNKKRSIGERRR